MEIESCIIMNGEPVDVKREEDIITKSKKKKKNRKRERDTRYPRSKMLSILC